MPAKFQQIGLIGTHRNPLVAETVHQIAGYLKNNNVNFVVETETAEALSNQAIKSFDLDKLGNNCDLVIAIGGDGNLLNAARHLSKTDTPVVGINRGQLGFLTDIKPKHATDIIQQVLDGNYTSELRFLVTADIMGANGKIKHSGNALNDIVLFPGEVAQLLEFELTINNKFVYSQRSDGLIISTPTGSTAYALSAGGPILQPELDAFVLVPKLPHTLTSRPLVISASSKVCIHIAEHNKTNPHLSYDGQDNIALAANDDIIIKRQEKPLKLLHPNDYDYYNVLRTKLQWGTQLIPLSRR